MEMEKLQLFAVLDAKMELYLAPITARNAAVAARIFETAVLQEGHDFNVHADDYSLWLVGEFDPGTGEVSALGLKSIVQGHHIINKHANQEVSSGTSPFNR